MAIQLERSDAGTKVVLSDVVDLGKADELLAALRDAHGSGQAYAIDGRAVSRIATPCLQLVLAALRLGEAARLASPSDAMMDAIIDLGLLPQVSDKMDLS